jgi:hypothetical protein
MGEKNALRGHDFHTKKRARFYRKAKKEERRRHLQLIID